MRRSKEKDAASAAAFNQLKAIRRGTPGEVDDTFLGAGSGKLNGRYGVATWDLTTLGGSVPAFTMLLFDWEVVFDQEFADGTAHGEYWDNPVPLKMMWSGTARMYVTAIEPTAVAAAGEPAGNYAGFLKTHFAAAVGFRTNADPALCTFKGYNTVNTTSGAPLTANKPIFEGSCYAARVGFSVPREGMATQEVQLRGVGAPTFGVYRPA